MSLGKDLPEVSSRSMRRLLLVGKNFLASFMPLRNAMLSMSMFPPFWAPQKAKASAAWSASPAGKVAVASALVLPSSSAPSENAELWMLR